MTKLKSNCFKNRKQTLEAAVQSKIVKRASLEFKQLTSSRQNINSIILLLFNFDLKIENSSRST